MIQFVKMQGNGNDFIILDNRDGRYQKDFLSRAAQKFCRRRHSLGADGILVVGASKEQDYSMSLFNADGSEGEMCGNGARCIARYAFEKGIGGRVQRFSTLAGVMEATVDSPFVDLAMGSLSLADGWFNRSVEAGGEVFTASFLTVGVPHAVLFPAGELSRGEMTEIGRVLRNNRALFPEGANINFVYDDGANSIKAVTYERGVEDLTDSCGTGSVASAVSWLVRDGKLPAERVVDVTNPGGVNSVTLHFSSDGERAKAFLRGRTVIVAEGFLTEE